MSLRRHARLVDDEVDDDATAPCPDNCDAEPKRPKRQVAPSRSRQAAVRIQALLRGRAVRTKGLSGTAVPARKHGPLLQEAQTHSPRTAASASVHESGSPSKRELKGASMMSCIANLANTNMGVGMLALPSAMASAGMLGGCSLLLLSSAIAAFGSHLLTECVELVGRPATISSLTERALGPCGVLLTSFSVVVISSTCATGYLIVVGDTMPKVVLWFLGEATPLLLKQRWLWILCSLPCGPRDPNLLSWAAARCRGAHGF
jgi:hypothetical protein